MNIVLRLNLPLVKTSFLTLLLTIIIFLSACSDSQISNPNAERPVDYTNSQSSVDPSALVPTGPNGIILSPQTDLRVTTGDSVNFTATANDSSGDTNISYIWDFDNVQANSTVQNPGLVTFLVPGRYEIELTAINSSGQADSTADTRKIIVESNSPQTDHEPIASIDSPVGDIAINVGDTIEFSGSGISPIANNPMTFLWNFGDILADNTVAEPGNIQFNQAGEFIISLMVTDSTGLVSVAPALVTITVNPIGSENLPPVGIITSPAGNLRIDPGEGIYFAGDATDPDGNEPISYAWDFAGVIPVSTLAIPDRVVFSDVGTYIISLTTTDSLGLADPNPPQVTITVGDTSIPQAPVLSNAILSPETDMTIELGQAINFSGAAANETTVGPLNYLWTFDGVTTNFVDQNPGEVFFNEAGIFTVKLTIADANGNIITHDDMRTITVVDPQALSVDILEPGNDLTINLGETISFSASITDPIGNVDFATLWTFDGAAPDSALITPDPVVFDMAGIFAINLNVTDPLTERTANAKARTITVIDPNTLQANILTPASNLTINIGDIVNITGEVIDPVGSTAIEYLWDFKGAAPNATVMSPGDISFETAGIFNIEFSVLDTVDLRTAQSNAVEIHVLDTNALQANILTPSNDMLIHQGDSIDFSAEVIDPLGTNPLTYSWEFDIADGISSELNPGLILFDAEGEFEVTFTASDAATSRVSNTVIRHILVTPPLEVAPPITPGPDPVPTAPQGIIESPVGDMTITVGSVIILEASGINPVNTPLNYNWDFNGALNLQVKNPGAVKFTTTGEYIITLIVSNEDGIVDPNPPSIIITVN